MKPKRTWCISTGAGSLKTGDFEFLSGGGLRLRGYNVQDFGELGAAGARWERAATERLKALVAKAGLGGQSTNVCLATGQVFTKVVKLPPVETAKVGQIIRYEAQQSFPYAMDEAVWDFQVLTMAEPGAGGTRGRGEVEVLLVGTRAEAVEGLFRVMEGSGVRLGLVDAPAGALVNAFRFNYPDLEGCSAILDIGAKNSQVILSDGGKVFARGVSMGSNQITNEFGAEMKLRWAEAEQMKLEKGVVGLGGAYEDPENREEAVLAKIARQFMTRLHMQVQQTLQFYKKQHGGTAPLRLFLAGGGTLLPYTREFFEEKLGIAGEYFNPLRRVQLAENLDRAELEKVAPLLGEVTGLALREMGQCPLELNLLPKAIRQKQEFARKKPYFVASICCALAGLLAEGIFYQQLQQKKSEWHEMTLKELIPLEKKARQLEKHQRAIQSAKSEIEELTGHLKSKFKWADRLTEMRNVLLTVEEERAARGESVGVWIERMGEGGQTEPPGEHSELAFTQEAHIRQLAAMNRNLAERYYGVERVAAVLRGAQTPAGDPLSANESHVLRLTLSAVSLKAKSGDPGADSALAYDVAEAFGRSAMVKKEGTRLEEVHEGSGTEKGTFTFGLRIELGRTNEM